MKCLCHVVLISNPLNIVVSYISYKYIINHSYWILLVAPPIHAGWICPVCSSSCGRSLLLLHRRAVTLAYLAARIEQLVWLKIGYIIPLNLMVYQCLIIIFPIKWPFWEVSAISRHPVVNCPEHTWTLHLIGKFVGPTVASFGKMRSKKESCHMSPAGRSAPAATWPDTLRNVQSSPQRCWRSWLPLQHSTQGSLGLARG